MQNQRPRPILIGMATKTVTIPDRPPAPQPELAPPGTPPHIAVAPGALDHAPTVIREPGESDERHQSRCELLAILLDHARPD